MKGVLPLRAAVLGLLILLSPFALAQVPQPGNPPPVEMEQVNINRADAETLAEMLDGVGLSRARAIVTYREEHGPFGSADELSLVSGIGEVTLERNRARISVATP